MKLLAAVNFRVCAGWFPQMQLFAQPGCVPWETLAPLSRSGKIGCEERMQERKKTTWSNADYWYHGEQNAIGQGAEKMQKRCMLS